MLYPATMPQHLPPPPHHTQVRPIYPCIFTTGQDVWWAQGTSDDRDIPSQVPEGSCRGVCRSTGSRHGQGVANHSIKSIHVTPVAIKLEEPTTRTPCTNSDILTTCSMAAVSMQSLLLPQLLQQTFKHRMRAPCFATICNKTCEMRMVSVRPLLPQLLQFCKLLQLTLQAQDACTLLCNNMQHGK